MTVPVIIFPNPLRMLLTLLRTHEALPAALATPVALPGGSTTPRVCLRLPDAFPAGCPLLQVSPVPGAGPRLVPQRLARANFDLVVYDPDPFTASDLAIQVAALALSLEQRRTAEGGFGRVQVTDPFPTPDPDTAVERYVTPISVTYRPS